MIFFKLKEGVDREQFWKQWTQVWGPPHVGWTGVKKWSLNRVINVETGDPDNCPYGIAEIWWENRVIKDYGSKGFFDDNPQMHRIREEFRSKVAGKVMAEVEEKVIIDL